MLYKFKMDLTFITDNIDSKTDKYVNKYIGLLDDEEKDDPIVIMELQIEKIRHKVYDKNIHKIHRTYNLYNKIYKLKNKIDSDIMRLKVKESLLNEDLQNIESRYINNEKTMDIYYMNRIIMLNNEIKDNSNVLKRLTTQLDFVNGQLDILLSNSDQVNEQFNQYEIKFSSLSNKLLDFENDMKEINIKINNLMFRKDNILCNSNNINNLK